MSSLLIAQCPSAEAATETIDQLISQYRSTFKRKPAVDLYVSTSFPTAAPKRIKHRGILYHPPVDLPARYSVTTRVTDPSDHMQSWDAEWMIAAAKTISLISSTS